MSSGFARSALVVVMAAVVVSVSAPAYASGNVLPAAAQPNGVSRADMAQALAVFTISGNDSAFLPQTPSQVLYGDPSTVAFTPDGSGLVETGTNAFTVHPGTLFFVPVFNVDDSPPVIGTFPTTNAEAQEYFFDPAGLGGRDFNVVVDGTTTCFGARMMSQDRSPRRRYLTAAARTSSPSALLVTHDARNPHRDDQRRHLRRRTHARVRDLIPARRVHLPNQRASISRIEAPIVGER